MSNQTLGEQRIRTKFNPDNDTFVDQIKQKSAELINLIEEYRNVKTEGGAMTMNGEQARLISLAQTGYEEAAMWAVKAVTF